ncbi:MAG: Hpt domain-containing protein [Planctomycetes bacterium]|nr:Hpt domain-containing protein [Planctomycetota bacterium]
MTQLDTQAGAIYSSLATDEDLAEIVEMFVDEMPGRVDTLRRQFGQSDWEELRRTSHQLKGSAGSYGFGQITPAAADLESALRDGEPQDRVEQLLDAVIALCERATAGTPA